MRYEKIRHIAILFSSLAELKKVGITTGFLFINVNNPGSQEFWNSIGWTVIPDIKYLYLEF